MQSQNPENQAAIVSNEIIDAIVSGDLSKSKDILFAENDYHKILRSLYILAPRQAEISNYIHSAIVYTDAISELIKRLFPEDPKLILDAALDYYCSLKYSDQNIPKPNSQELDSTVVLSEFFESINNGDPSKAFTVSKKLLKALETKTQFNQLLMEIATKSYTETAESIIVINSVCKAMKFFDWTNIDDLVWFACNFLTIPRFRSEHKKLTPSDKEIMYSEYALKAASNPGKHGENLLFMGHSRQIYIATKTISKEIWPFLSSFIQTKLDDMRIEELEEIEPATGDIVDFEKSIAVKDVQLSMTYVNQILKTEVNIGELFGCLALSIIEDGKFKDPEMIIFLNVARRLANALEYPSNLIVYKSFLSYLYSDIHS